MPELWMIKKGETLTPADDAAMAFLMSLVEGRPTPIKVSNPRSSAHHRLFFGAIANAFKNWPEAHSEQFINAEELRGWLLCKAGYRTHLSLDLDHPDYAEKCADMFSLFIKQAFGHRKIFFKGHGAKLVAFIPESIAFDKLSQTEFNKISSEVSDILKSEINMSLDDFKNREAA